MITGWILTVLRGHNADAALFDEIAYWSPAQAITTEVDFVLRRGRDYLAIEAKARPRVDTRDLAGLRAIAGLPRLKRRIVVYLGSRALRTADGIEVWPVGRFVEALADGRVWP